MVEIFRENGKNKTGELPISAKSETETGKREGPGGLEFLQNRTLSGHVKVKVTTTSHITLFVLESNNWIGFATLFYPTLQSLPLSKIFCSMPNI